MRWILGLGGYLQCVQPLRTERWHPAWTALTEIDNSVVTASGLLESNLMPLCPECGALFTEKTEGDWYDILATLSDRVPSQDHCQAWLDSKGISDEDAEQTATSMLASLRYDKKAGVWRRGKTEYVQIWATFRAWCLNDLRWNGHRAGSSMTVKKGTRY